MLSRRALSYCCAAAGFLLTLCVLWAGSGRDASAEPDQVFRSALGALERNDFDEVRRAVRLLEKHPGYRSHVLMLRAAQLLHANDPQRALDHLHAMDPLPELRAPALDLVGRSLEGVGDFKEAIVVYRRLSQEQPTDPDPRLRLGELYQHVGDAEAAKAEFRAAIALRPNDYRGYRLLGSLFSSYMLDTEAVACLEEALRHDPPASERAEIAVELAQWCMAISQPERALALLEELEPSEDVLPLHAECLLKLGRHDEARRLLQVAVAQYPDNPAVNILRAQILVLDGKLHEAVAALQGVLERDPHDIRCRYQLALVYGRLGDQQAYAAEMDRKRQSEEMSERFYELYKKASVHPQDAALREEMADLCSQLGQRDLAERWATAAAFCRRSSETGDGKAAGE